MTAPRPAHTKATVKGRQLYACVKHADDLRLAAFQPVTDITDAKARVPLAVLPSERDSANVWCSFCNKEQS